MRAADTPAKPVPIFSDPSQAADYQLLELPKEVADLLEKAAEDAGSRKRKHPDDDGSEDDVGSDGEEHAGNELVCVFHLCDEASI